ncbi:MAG: hypothetical protein IJ335_00970 [Lachnospiraceae bacterium]|nr:hypothetical protein [Lachnospiraceae bacterium]
MAETEGSIRQRDAIIQRARELGGKLQTAYKRNGYMDKRRNGYRRVFTNRGL